MAANVSAICTSFKAELMLGAHQFGSVTIVSRTSLTSPTTDTLKAALYLTNQSIGTGTNYTAGGATVTNANAPSTSGTSAVWTPSASITWTNVTLSTAFDTVLLYNSTQSNRAILAFNFGSQTITAGNFTLTMPANTPNNAVITLT